MFARKIMSLCALAIVSACAVWPAGKDPKGKELCDNARPVLAALAAYEQQNGQYPQSLHELVPNFIVRIPFNPGLRFHRDTGIVEFAYTPSWPQTEEVYCAAHAREADWTCRSRP